MMTTPMFLNTYYFVKMTSLEYDAVAWAATIQAAGAANISDDEYNHNIGYWLRQTYETKQIPILNMTAQYVNDPPNKFIYIWTAESSAWVGLRNSEKLYGFGTRAAAPLEGKREVNTFMVVSNKATNVYNSWIAICKTLSVCI